MADSATTMGSGVGDRGSAARAQARDIWMSALWLGLAGGALEVAALLVRKYALGQMLGISAHYPWMVPLANVALLGGFAGVLTLRALARKPQPLVPLHTAAGFLALFAALAPLLVFTSVHHVASMLLAAGIAWRVRGWVRAHPERWRRLTRRTTPWMAVAVVVAAMVIGGTRWTRERRALAALPAAPRGAPNIILIILDTVRAAQLGLHGYPRPTSPALDAYARGGVVFDRALATAPWTLPSHASIFTGRDAHELGADWLQPLGAEHRTLAESLRDRGYVTTGIVANTVYTGWEVELDRGFAHYEDYRVSPAEIVNSSSVLSYVLAGRLDRNQNGLRVAIDRWEFLGRKKADRITDDFLRWTERDRPAGRPFFAFLNYFDAHLPHTPGAEYRRRFGVRASEKSFFERGPDEWPSGLSRDAYDATIAEQDAQVGRLLAELERRGVLRNAIVVITSDHGELLGEHGLYEHGNSLYMELLHVPLVVVAPGRAPAGARVPSYATLRSLPATILDLAGLPDSAIAGPSLAPLWRGGVSSPAPAFASVRRGINTDPALPVSRGDMYSIVSGTHHLIRNGDGREELYDLAADPGEARDLAGTPAAAETRARLRDQLDSALVRGPR